MRGHKEEEEQKKDDDDCFLQNLNLHTSRTLYTKVRYDL